MSFSFGSKSEKASSSSKTQTDPWDVTIPYLKDFLAKTKTVSSGTPGATADQTAAYEQLKTNAQAGNPYASDMDALTKDLFGAESYAPEVASGYDDFSRRLTPTADGTNIDIANNTYLQNLLKTVGDDIQWRTNSQFAGAGRDMSAINQQAVARGVSQATAPLLLDQYNKEVSRSDAAARDLFAGNNTAATTKANLDASNAALRGSGIEAADAAVTARDQGANAILNLEQQMKQMPYEELSWLAELLYPAAGLGQQSTESGTSKAKGTSFGAGLKLI